MNALLAALLLGVGVMPDINKEDVRKLLAAGISQETIVEFIRKHAPAEPLTTDDLTELKKAGAGEEVLKAMVEASRATQENTRAYSSPGTTVVFPSYATYPSPYYSSYSYYPSYSYYHRPYRTYPYYYSYPRHPSHSHYSYRHPYSYGSHHSYGSYRHNYHHSTPYRYTAPAATPRHGVGSYRR